MITHPSYQRYAPRWRRYCLAYEGGDPYLDLALQKHEHERTDGYAARRKRAIYPNHVRSIIDTYAAHLYRDSIPREVDGAAAQILPAFWADVDMLGNPADEFYEEVAQHLQTQGRAAIVTDRWDPADVVTRAQERDVGRRPYSYAVRAEDLIDWDVDRRGRLVWVAVREVADQERQPLTSSSSTTHHYRIWYRDRWELWVEVEGDDEDEGPSYTQIDGADHPVGEVPVTMLFWGKRHGRQPLADSAIKDLEPQNRRLVNLVSYIDEQISQYVFSILAAPQSTYDVLPGVNWSTTGALPYPDDCANPPHYISPDVAQIGALRSEIDKTESTIRQLSGLGRVNEEGRSVQTGIALSYLTFDKDALLAKFAARMIRAEAQVDRHAAAWMAVDFDDAAITRGYPTVFDPQDLKDSLDAALKTVSLGITGEALGEVQAHAVRELLGGHLDGERLKTVIDDLKARLDTGAPTGA